MDESHPHETESLLSWLLSKAVVLASVGFLCFSARGCFEPVRAFGCSFAPRERSQFFPEPGQTLGVDSDLYVRIFHRVPTRKVPSVESLRLVSEAEAVALQVVRTVELEDRGGVLFQLRPERPLSADTTYTFEAERSELTKYLDGCTNCGLGRSWQTSEAVEAVQRVAPTVLTRVDLRSEPSIRLDLKSNGLSGHGALVEVLSKEGTGVWADVGYVASGPTTSVSAGSHSILFERPYRVRVTPLTGERGIALPEAEFVVREPSWSEYWIAHVAELRDRVLRSVLSA